MYQQAGYGAALLFLAYLSFQDIKTKLVSARAIWISGMAALLYLFLGQSGDAKEWTIRVIPGMVLLLVSWMTKESLGYGDGAAVIVLGLWCGTFFCVLILCLGIILSGIYALYCMAAGRTSPLPFLPFLLTAMEVILLYE